MMNTQYWKLLNGSTGKLNEIPYSAFMHGKQIYSYFFANVTCLIIATNCGVVVAF